VKSVGNRMFLKGYIGKFGLRSLTRKDFRGNGNNEWVVP
jgi:hypothetical protein